MINDHVLAVKAPARGAAARLEPRRRPQQTRSRERVHTILGAARQLIGTRGNDAVSVREIAAAAGVPISSVYQYFPDKNAIIRELIADHLATVRERVVAAFGRVRRAEDLPGASATALDGLLALFSDEPRMATIWAAVQANTVLRELDAQDSREIAAYLSSVLLRVLPGLPRQELEGVCLFAAQVPSSVIRIALGLDARSRGRLLGELKGLARLRMSDLVARSRRAAKAVRTRGGRSS
jgi:AcrR family transcriptional regulator